MKMKLNFCEKKARKPLVSLQKNIAEHFSSAMMVGEGGFEPPKSLTADLQSVPFGHSGIPPYSLAEKQLRMEPVDGLEPPTC